VTLNGRFWLHQGNNSFGREWRLDTVLQLPADQERFVMFDAATSGHETYSGSRFLRGL